MDIDLGKQIEASINEARDALFRELNHEADELTLVDDADGLDCSTADL